MVATFRQPRRRHLESENGFTIVEFMVAALIMTIVLGGTVALTTQIQQAYGTQLDDVAVEQEARFALDWIARDLRSAASDPYQVIADNQEVVTNPDGAAPADDSIRVRADINPPDNDPLDDGEDVEIAFDSANNVITRWDRNADPAALAMTEAIFIDLSFTYFDAAHAPLLPTDNSELFTYVRVEVIAQSRARNRYTGEFTTSTLATEVRLRTR